MQRDERTYIRVHDGMPDHPKVEGLSDKAFRLLIETWCWSSRHLTDGYVREAVWSKRGSPAARRELVTEGLAEPVVDREGGVQMHDYTEWQRTKDEVEEIRADRSGAGSVGNHRRWHEARGIVRADCRYCVAPAIANGSQVRSQTASQTDRKTSPKSESDSNNPSTDVDGATQPLIDLTPTSRRGARLDEAWQPDPETRAWTITQLDADTARTELEKFRNYWLAKAGRDATKLDWGRTWRNWVLKAAEQAPQRRRSTTDDRVQAALDLRDRLAAQEATGTQTAIGASR